MVLSEKIVSPSDIKKLNIKELKILCDELREEIISVTRENGGHLSSNLGIVETTVALHYVFDLPTDKLVFDVGHQCYAHKILSGRKDEFSSVRQDGGISGFPDPEESEYDAFTTGHAGTSVSVGLGMCFARELDHADYRVIDVVGDGSFVNGLNLEALTASEKKPKNFLVVLNDNEMSISKNTNGLYKILSRGTTKQSYINSKKAFKKIFGESFITKFFRKIKNGIKHLLNKNDYFENFGFKYVGVADGNNIGELIKTLTRIKNTMKDRAVFLHIKTTKGKGYVSAEQDSDVYHGVGKNLSSGTGIFSTNLGLTLNKLIEKDDKIVAITAGMKDGTGLSIVEKAHPNNFIDVGIAEEYAVTLSAGMAKNGAKPVVAVYSTFLQRAYDEILHDVCLSSLPVIFCVDRAGFVGADGKTHQGLYDLSYLSHLPNMKIFAPSTIAEFNDVLEYAFTLNCPVAIRYPNEKTCEERVSLPIKDGLWEKLNNPSKYDCSVLAVGPRMIKLAFEVFEKTHGKCLVINARTVKPLDEKVLNGISDKPVITLEENSVVGGFGSQVSAYYSKTGKCVKVLSFGAKDEFIKHGTVENQLAFNGLTADNIVSRLSENLGATYE